MINKLCVLLALASFSALNAMHFSRPLSPSYYNIHYEPIALNQATLISYMQRIIELHPTQWQILQQTADDGAPICQWYYLKSRTSPARLLVLQGKFHTFAYQMMQQPAILPAR